MTAALRPPLASFGYFSPSLAPKEEKRKVPELIIHVTYDLEVYCYSVAPESQSGGLDLTPPLNSLMTDRNV